MNTNEAVIQLVEQVLPNLVRRLKECEDGIAECKSMYSAHEEQAAATFKGISRELNVLRSGLDTVREHMFDDAAKLSSLEMKLSSIEKLIAEPPAVKKRSRKKKVQEQEDVSEQVSESQPGASNEPLDLLPYELDFLDTVYRQVGDNVDTAVEAFGVDRDKYVIYVQSCVNSKRG